MSAGAILPRDPRQSPKGNWRALKAGLIKNDFAAPAEQWARREKLSIEESKMECHIKPSLKKKKHKNKKRKLAFDVTRKFV